MICPGCGKPMKHLNNGGWFMAPDRYQTYDYLECASCEKVAIEFYHTALIDIEEMGKIASINVWSTGPEEWIEWEDGHHMDELLRIIHTPGEEMTDEQCLDAITEYIETNIKHSI